MLAQSRSRIAAIAIVAAMLGLTACDQRSEVAGTKRTDPMYTPSPTADVKDKIAATTDKVATAVDDTTLTAKVKASLLAEPGLRALPISVETRNGAVTLSGTVDSDASRNRAKEVARSVAGVAAVVDELSVKS